MNTFYMPVKIFSGQNVIREKCQELKLLSNKALIVTGKSSSKKNGSLKCHYKRKTIINNETLSNKFI